jgi:hypothetical protein
VSPILYASCLASCQKLDTQDTVHSHSNFQRCRASHTLRGSPDTRDNRCYRYRYCGTVRDCYWCARSESLRITLACRSSFVVFCAFSSSEGVALHALSLVCACWCVVNEGWSDRALTSLLTQVRLTLNAYTWPGGLGRHQATLCEGCMRGLPPGGAPCYTPDHLVLFCRS